jgi:hypothetical protein
MAEQAPAQPIPEEVAKRGYQGTQDPGSPTSLMQVQTKPAGQGQGAAPAAAPEQGESPAAHTGSDQGDADS